jgi:hypothetical protein
MVNYKQLFHEDYSDIVRKIVDQPKKISIVDRIKKIYNNLFDKHTQVTDSDFSILCKLAYSNEGILQEFINPLMQKKYQIIDFINSDDGLQFYVIKSKLSKDLIFAFRGTDEWVDWLTNLQIMQKKRQFETAKLYLDKIIAENIDCQIYFCGHSLGGALAQSMYLNYQGYTKVKIIRAVTFNSAGVRLKNEQSYSNLSITNYIIENDIVGSATGYHYGKTIYLKLSNIVKNKSMLKLYTHSLDQFVFDEFGKINNEVLNKNENKIG